MKKIIILFTLFITYTVDAQTYPILRTVTIEQSVSEEYNRLTGDYIQDTNNLMNPYIGIWKYEGGGITYILKIQKVSQFISISNIGSYYFYDKLIITYKFIKDDITLVDNLNEPLIYTFHNIDNEVGRKYGVFDFNESTNYLTGVITDIPLNITTSSDIYPVNPIGSVFEKIKIQYNGINSLRGNPQEFYIDKPTFMLPNYVELIKQ